MEGKKKSEDLVLGNRRVKCQLFCDMVINWWTSWWIIIFLPVIINPVIEFENEAQLVFESKDETICEQDPEMALSSLAQS